MESATFTFRPITEEDGEFLYELYASTRTAELAVVPWSEAEKEEFLRMQFDAQHTHYQQHYADAQFDLILQQGQPIGRLYLQRRGDEHRVVDISLLPAYRGQGIGGRIMQDVLDEAERARLPVRIHVEQHNPAMQLYHRLGFTRAGDTGVYFLMEWMPPARATP